MCRLSLANYQRCGHLNAYNIEECQELIDQREAIEGIGGPTSISCPNPDTLLTEFAPEVLRDFCDGCKMRMGLYGLLSEYKAPATPPQGPSDSETPAQGPAISDSRSQHPIQPLGEGFVALGPPDYRSLHLELQNATSQTRRSAPFSAFKPEIQQAPRPEPPQPPQPEPSQASSLSLLCPGHPYFLVSGQVPGSSQAWLLIRGSPLTQAPMQLRPQRLDASTRDAALSAALESDNKTGHERQERDDNIWNNNLQKLKERHDQEGLEQAQALSMVRSTFPSHNQIEGNRPDETSSGVLRQQSLTTQNKRKRRRDES